MYLEAKYKEQKESGLRGACNGLFPFAPKSENEEIGYWRKNYTLSDFLWDKLGITDDDNCVEFEMSEQDLLDTIKFCQDKGWGESVDIFNNALKLMREQGAIIYYREWY